MSVFDHIDCGLNSGLLKLSFHMFLDFGYPVFGSLLYQVEASSYTHLKGQNFYQMSNLEVQKANNTFIKCQTWRFKKLITFCHKNQINMKMCKRIALMEEVVFCLQKSTKIKYLRGLVCRVHVWN
jgi:hypothetical protein